jgi:c(7)-type cytochrome triheme protein
MNIPVPHEYGSVIIRNFSGQAGPGAVRFDHWLHRVLYTCRLCHVDIGFAMEANATKIDADTNMKGFYCGSCHNGTRTRVRGSKKIFAACSLSATPGEDTRCSRCHSVGKNVQKEYKLYFIYEEAAERKSREYDRLARGRVKGAYTTC